VLKKSLRKKILKIRKKINSNSNKIDFIKIFNLIKKQKKIKKNIGGYFPVNNEIDDLEILKKFEEKKYKICLPVVKKNFDMDFYNFSFKEPLIVNKYGIPEPKKTNIVYPDIILIPMVAFDKNLNRLGYGGGYYDRIIEKLMKKKNFLKIGLAFSKQKINNLSISKYDKKMDYIVTEKYIL
jgi:5-formyltetrahydrofolate cyclo-ligase